MAQLIHRDLVPPSGRFRTAVDMSTPSGRSRARKGGGRAWFLLAVAAAAAAVALVGCSSSKPAYCTDRANLQNSAKGLTSLITSRDISGLKTQVGTIQNDATAVVSSAKSDFPSQTSAITSSVDALKSSVTALPPSPSASDIATAAKDAASVASSVKTFDDATSSQCG
jgi:hypothetical protein